MSKDKGTYQVGFGKPPLHTRFEPGKSGNSQGRPKRKASLEDDLEKVLSSLISITEAGVRKKIRKQEALLKQHVNKAIEGDIRSAMLVVEIAKRKGVVESDTLEAVLQEFRQKNAQHEAVLGRDPSNDDEPGPSEK